MKSALIERKCDGFTAAKLYSSKEDRVRDILEAAYLKGFKYVWLKPLMTTAGLSEESLRAVLADRGYTVDDYMVYTDNTSFMY